MNEQIRELAKHAGAVTGTELTDVTDALVLIGKEEIQAFAELIIQSCVSQGRLIQNQTVENGSEDYCTGRDMGIEVFINEIRNHFGVKS